MTHKHSHKEQGAALIISLMILLIMTIIGVSALSNTSLEERMSKNFQHTNMAFQASESAIEKVISTGDTGGTGIFENKLYTENTDSLLTALNAGINDTTTSVSYNMDPDSILHNTSLTTQSAVTYTRKEHCLGMSIDNFRCFAFDITAVATVDASNSQQTHLQGVSRPAPKLGGNS